MVATIAGWTRVGGVGRNATRNNTGVAHENGVIESSNRHIKAQIEQALRIRGSFDFNCRDDYEGFIQQLVGRRNKRINSAFIKEQRQLQPLPPVGSVNYSTEYVRVSRTSTINVKHGNIGRICNIKQIGCLSC